MRNVLPANAKLVPPEATCVFKGVIFDVYQWQQKMFDGSFETFEMLKRPDTVKVLAIKEDKIIIIKEEQPGSDAFYDLPGGRHDNEAETELQAAQRELLEETGLSFQDWKLIQVFQPQGKIEQFVYIFLATNFSSQVAPVTDAGEKITTKFLTLDEVKQMLDSPKNRYLPDDIFDSVSSVNELLQLPAIEG